jgi:hypothetical protein
MDIKEYKYYIFISTGFKTFLKLLTSWDEFSILRDNIKPGIQDVLMQSFMNEYKKSSGELINREVKFNEHVHCLMICFLLIYCFEMS